MRDVLRVEGASIMEQPHAERRRLLEGLRLEGDWWSTPETFADGQLYAAVCKRGLEGLVAKWRKAPYRPRDSAG